MTQDLVIGSGVAGLETALALKQQNIDFKWISAETAWPSASHSSTSLISLHGQTKGHGPLGDLLVDSYSFFVKNCSKRQGVEKMRFYFIGPSSLEDRSRFDKRYGHLQKASSLPFKNSFPGSAYLSEGFHIDNSTYLKGLIHEIGQTPLECELGEITRQGHGDPFKALDTLGTELNAKRIFFCGGRTAPHLLPKELIPTASPYPYGQSVSGSWCKWRNRDLGEESWCVTYDGVNLFYSATANEVGLGATTTLGEWRFCEREKLEAYYNLLNRFLPKGLLPPLEDATPFWGVRHKASKRRPIVIKERNLSILAGLYKNGFTLAPYLVHRDLMEKNS